MINPGDTVMAEDNMDRGGPIVVMAGATGKVDTVGDFAVWVTWQGDDTVSGPWPKHKVTKVSDRCGGCRDLGPHNYGPGCEHQTPGGHPPMAERIAEGLSKPLNLDAFRGTPGTTPEAGRTEPREPEAMSRGAALATGDRMDEYGDPNLSFDRIAGLWSAYVTAPGVDAAALTAEDVARMMILLKVSRSLTDTKADTLDDIDGYTACIRLLRGIDVT